MNRTKIVFTAIAAALLSMALPASATTLADPVLASFERMLDHRPHLASPALPAGFPVDPLVSAVHEPLWRAAPTRLASASDRADSLPSSSDQPTRRP